MESFPAARFTSLLVDNRYDLVTGVPCSLVKTVIASVLERGEPRYIPENREDAAVGFAVGAAMAGARPVVIMQNSGLGVATNALCSLAVLYRVPSLLLVTWRGEGSDAPEHVLMGRITPGFLENLEIPFRVPRAASLEEDLAWATRAMADERRPVALLISKGLFS